MALILNEPIVDPVRIPAQTTPGIRLLLLGSFRYIYEQQTTVLSGSVAALFGYLALHASNGRVMQRGRIADTLWPSAPVARAQRTLSETLYRLRQALGPAAVCLRANEKVIGLGGVIVDRDEFCALAGAADLPEWRAALELYVGDLLEDLDAEWLLSERAALHEIYLGTLTRACTCLAENGNFIDALVYAHRWTTADPFNEDAQRAAMRLYARLGRYIAALQQYDQLVRLLEDELQTSPLPETRALANAIRAEYHALPPIALPPRPLAGRCPERGLLLRLAERAQTGHGGIALLEGEPGSGKTRLLEVLAEGAAWRGMRVVWGSAAHATPGLPLVPLTPALQAALAGSWGAYMGRCLPAEAIGALVSMLPCLSEAVQPKCWTDAPEQQTIAQAIAQLLGALAQARPHLLLLDDAQTADSNFWMLLRLLAPHLAHQRVLIILSYRPDVVRANPIAWETVCALDAEQAAPRVTLDGLSLEECEELAAMLGVAVAQTALLALYQQAGGNPTLLSELLLAPPGDHQPVTVREWLQLRLAVFPAKARSALQMAATLGPTCTHAAWQKLMSVPIHDHVALLVGGGILAETEDGYAFRHRLIYEHVRAETPPDGLIYSAPCTNDAPGSISFDTPASTTVSAVLARVDAPFGKPLTDLDRVAVRWTVDAGTPDQVLLERAGKVALRRYRIMRLIGEAQAQRAAPTDADLARALAVTQRTIEADMAAIRSTGIATPTRRRV